MFSLESNLDDMNPEIFGYIACKLFEQGALDVYRIPILMKKERLGVILSVLCREEDKEKLKETMFLETGTLGIREQLCSRTKLERRFAEVATRYGKASVKMSYYEGRLVNSKPEYEDCKKLAKENGVPIRAVYDEITRRLEGFDDEER